MENILSSDLEEGEILEYDYSPEHLRNNDDALELGKNSLQLFQRGISDQQISPKQDKNRSLYLSNSRKEGYVPSDLKEKVNMTMRKVKSKTGGYKSNFKLKYSSSSDGEYKSDAEKNYIFNDSRHSSNYISGKHEKDWLKKKYSGQVIYGTVEDIMSQIDQTICRKSRCNYKRRKSRDVKYSLGRFYPNKSSSSDLSSEEGYSSHFTSVKNKRRKQKVSSSESYSETFSKEDIVKEKSAGSRKRKKKGIHYYNDRMNHNKERETVTKKSSFNKVRDFDEVRRKLLEKLKKQKAEDSKGIHQSNPQSVAQELVNSEITEVEMLIDAENYKNTSPEMVCRDLTNSNQATEIINQNVSESKNMENEGDDEIDIIKLRLIALASNKKHKNKVNVDGISPKTEKSFSNLEECSSTERRSEDNSSMSRDDEDTDLDRYELLLRAEALKTALLKKHQRRLNKLKTDKSKTVGNSNENEVTISGVGSVPIPLVYDKPDSKCDNSDLYNTKLDADAFKENVNSGSKSELNVNFVETPNTSVDSKTIKNATSAVTNINSRKRRSSIKNGKNKKKIILPSTVNKDTNLKVNESMEEDDRTLRRELLTDLIKRQTMKDSDKKSVLMDSMQISDTKRSGMPKIFKPELNSMPAIVYENVNLKKVNVSKPTKINNGPSISKPEIQRIIVHLGSEDSSDDDLETSTPETSETVTQKNRSENKVLSDPNPSIVSKQSDEAIRASYERRVELLLSQTHKEIEEMQKAKKNLMATPEAVYKHLPPSQRLEYIRLKQKIAERERLKQRQKAIPKNLSSPHGASTTSLCLTTTKNEFIKDVSEKPNNLKSGNISACGAGNESTVVPPVENSSSAKESNVKSLSTKTDISKNSTDLKAIQGAKYSSISKRTNPVRSPVNTKTLNSAIGNKLKSYSTSKISLKNRAAQPNGWTKASIPSAKSFQLLPNQALISKLKILLKKIKIEKTIEENYEKEIMKLKNQLNLFDKKKVEQRFKIKKLAEESWKIYRIIQNSIGSCYKTSENSTKTEKEEKPRKEKCAEKSGDAENAEKEEKREKLEKAEKAEKAEKTGNLEAVDNAENIEKLDKVFEDEDKETGRNVEAKSNEDNSVSEDNPRNEIMNNGSAKELQDTRPNELATAPVSLSYELVKYNSPLDAFSKTSNGSERIDPNVIVCHFDLMGICKDEECKYQHFRTS